MPYLIYKDEKLYSGCLLKKTLDLPFVQQHCTYEECTDEEYLQHFPQDRAWLELNMLLARRKQEEE